MNYFITFPCVLCGIGTLTQGHNIGFGLKSSDYLSSSCVLELIDRVDAVVVLDHLVKCGLVHHAHIHKLE